MKQLIILVPNGENNLSSITGTYEVFTKANEYWEERGKKQLFTIQLAGVSDKTDFNKGLFTVTPHLHIDDVKEADLIIVPS